MKKHAGTGGGNIPGGLYGEGLKRGKGFDRLGAADVQRESIKDIIQNRRDDSKLHPYKRGEIEIYDVMKKDLNNAA